MKTWFTDPDAQLIDLMKQGCMKLQGNIKELPDKWLYAFYEDSLDWAAEKSSDGSYENAPKTIKLTVERYRKEIERRAENGR